jgi:Fe-S-cluster containining protein
MKKFFCKACGKCCSGDGSVFLYPDDIKRMAERLDLSVQEFADKYTDHIMLEGIEEGGSYFYMPYLILKKNKGISCVFLKDKVCSIHEFKPIQCSITPFTSEFFEDEKWRQEITNFCPALKTMDSGSLSENKNIADLTDEVEKKYLSELREHGFNLETMLDISLKAPEIIKFEEDEDNE